MAHYQERARVHTHSPARTSPAPPPMPAGAAGSTKRIDCDTCPIAGRGCGDCMVALLGPVRFRLDAVEDAAVGELLTHNLITAREAADAYATPDLPGQDSSGRSGPGSDGSSPSWGSERWRGTG